MKKNRTIVHITSEVAPFYKRGGMGDVVGALPQYLESEHTHNIVICPFYDGKMKHMDGAERGYRVINYQGIPYDFNTFYLRRNGIDHYFIKLSDSGIMSEWEDHDGYRPYSAPSTIVPYFYFAGAALELILHRDLTPDYIFCHDWHTGGCFGFTGLLEQIKNKKEFKSLFMVHNYEFQGDLHEDIYQNLDRDIAAQLEEIFSRYKQASLLALALKNSDYAATVSHSYARELVEGRAPHIGLKYLDLCNREMLSFLNGSDSSLWRPETSPYLPVPYGVDTLERKKDIKKMILGRYGFDDPGNTGPPLVLMLCRLTAQKGIGLFTGIQRESDGSTKNMEILLEQDNRFFICGNPGGGAGGIIDNALADLQKKFSGRLCYLNHYSDELAHHLLAAADILLAPSLFEPCGLIQIYAMAFGTVPVVRSVGGMRDTVRCYFEDPGTATGFYINEFSRNCLQTTLRSVTRLYHREPLTWRRIMERGMAADFSWERMCRQYLRFFDRLEGDDSLLHPARKNSADSG